MALLSTAEARLFWEQHRADQRHGLLVGRRVLAALPGDREAACAGLLHDVGKRQLRLGAIQRSVATVLSGVGLSLRGAYRDYLEHGRLGAEALEEVGSAELVIAFARHHPGSAPAGTDAGRWQALLDADHA